ncbi:MAG: endonuclease domain-containing protein [Beijerinckiaceae bacterium]
MAEFDHTPVKTARARRLRRDMTRYERQLWERLKNSQLGVSFRRQHPLGPFIVDFAAPSIQLIIELDGGHHGTPIELQRDQQRDAILVEKGFYTLRFWNAELFENTEGIVETIWNAVQERLPIVKNSP